MAETVRKMNIYEAISKCMEEIGAVGKNDRNNQQGFMYRGIDAVMNAINPALVNNHVFVVPEVLEQRREERPSKSGGLLIYSICKIKYTFFAEDGSFITAVTIGEGMDSGDKATNKAMAIAFKYACFQVFCIPTEEMKDPDAEVHEIADNKPKPATAEQLHKINEFVDAYAEMCEGVTSKDVFNELKKKYHFKHTGDLSVELADKLIEQVEAWYHKKKEADS